MSNTAGEGASGERHYRFAVPPEPIESHNCPICVRVELSHRLLVEHMRAAHRPCIISYVCKTCGYTGSNKFTGVRTHISRVHGRIVGEPVHRARLGEITDGVQLVEWEAPADPEPPEFLLENAEFPPLGVDHAAQVGLDNSDAEEASSRMRETGESAHQSTSTTDTCWRQASTTEVIKDQCGEILVRPAGGGSGSKSPTVPSPAGRGESAASRSLRTPWTADCELTDGPSREGLSGARSLRSSNNNPNDRIFSSETNNLLGSSGPSFAAQTGGFRGPTSSQSGSGPERRNLFCEVCHKGPFNALGLTAHRRQIHPDAQNELNLARILANTRKPRQFWTDQELRRLHRLVGDRTWRERRNLFPSILDQFPGRNIEALDRACYDAKYLEIAAQARINSAQSPESGEVGPESGGSSARDSSECLGEQAPGVDGPSDLDERASAQFVDYLLRFSGEIMLSAECVNDPSWEFAMGLRSIARGDDEYDLERLYASLLLVLAPKISARNRNTRGRRSAEGETIGDPEAERASCRAGTRRQTRRVVAPYKTPTGNRNRNRRSNRRCERGAAYKAHQDLWRKNRSALWKYVRNGWPSDCGLDLSEATSFWSEYFGRTSVRDDEPLKEKRELNDVWSPVESDELEQAIRHQKDKAPGPDGLEFDQVRRTPMVFIQAFLNACLFKSAIPSALTLCRTVLIPKKDGVTDPSGCRPITMSSILIRILNSILAKRVMGRVTLHPSQRGFVPVDGCMENITLLNWVMRSAIATNRAQCLMLLDVAKAFDSVSHHSIRRALRGRGASARIIRYVENAMFRCQTRVDIGSDRSEYFPMTSGVKQGDPLSPVFFNLVVDELLEELDSFSGYRTMGDQAVSVQSLAFADDLVLVTESEAEMQGMVRACETFYRKRGMILNGKKSVSLVRVTAPKSQTSALKPEHSIKVGGESPRTISKVSDLFRYLGIDFNPNGKTSPNRVQLEAWLASLRKAPLKAEQKLFFLRSFLVPSLIHEAVLSRMTNTLLDTWDGQVKAFVKECLHLPVWAIDGLIYLPCRMGGLGVPRLRYLIPRLTLNRLRRLSDSNHPLIQSWLQTGECVRLTATCEKYLIEETPRGGSFNLTTKDGEAAYWKWRSENTSDGKGTPEFSRVTGIGNAWLCSGSKVLSGERYIKAVKLRFNALPIGDNAVRHLRSDRARHETPTARCRFGCRAQETLCHAIQYCPHTMGSRTQGRHDALVADIATYLRDVRKYEVRTEEGFRLDSELGRELLKPDLVVFDRSKRQLYILDVTCPWEGSEDLERAAQDKVLKYQRVSSLICDTYNRRYGYALRPIESRNVFVNGIVFGARGGFPASTWNVLRRQLGVAEQRINLWSELTVFRTICVYNHFCRGDTRGSRRAGRGRQRPD